MEEKKQEQEEQKPKSIGFFFFGLLVTVLCVVGAVYFYQKGDNRSVLLAICAVFWVGYCVQMWKAHQAKP